LAVDYNLVAESGSDCVFDQQKVAIADLPSRGLEAHGVRSAPRLVNPDANDFRPAKGSPVIDRGANLGDLVPTDMRGVRRPQGSGYDIGPFEFAD